MKNSKQVMVWFVGTDIIRRLIFFILLFFLTTDIYAQNKNISGRVIDFAGEPVIGASVLVNGTSNGTISDIDGKFSLFNVPAKGTITVTYIGYKIRL